MSSKESKSTQLSLSKPSEPKCSQMCLNKLKGAWICLDEPKSALMSLNELRWAWISVIVFK